MFKLSDLGSRMGADWRRVTPSNTLIPTRASKAPLLTNAAMMAGGDKTISIAQYYVCAILFKEAITWPQRLASQGKTPCQDKRSRYLG
jgi:hypothetical protein